MSREVGVLSITRKPGESVLVGEDVEIFVAEIRRGLVRLRCAAPRDVRILRDEMTCEGHAVHPCGCCRSCRARRDREDAECSTSG